MPHLPVSQMEHICNDYTSDGSYKKLKEKTIMAADHESFSAGFIHRFPASYYRLLNDL